MRRLPLYVIVVAAAVIGCALVTGPCELDLGHQRVVCQKEGAAIVVAPAKTIEAAGEAASDARPQQQRVRP